MGAPIYGGPTLDNSLRPPNLAYFPAPYPHVFPPGQMAFNHNYNHFGLMPPVYQGNNFLIDGGNPTYADLLADYHARANRVGQGRQPQPQQGAAFGATSAAAYVAPPAAAAAHIASAARQRPCVATPFASTSNAGPSGLQRSREGGAPEEVERDYADGSQYEDFDDQQSVAPGNYSLY